MQANRGASGIDEQTLEKFDKELSKNLYKLWNRLSSGSYFPPPVKVVEIAKKQGGVRRLGVPTVKNRVAQAIVKNALEPSWEARFEANSYGFRPGRSCQDAIEHCPARLRTSKNCPNDRWLLDGDLQSAFDTLHHEFILSRLGAMPGRELVKQWLKAGYVEAEMLPPTLRGAAQGAVLTPPTMLLNVP